ncbi:MAG: endo-1,4-beta-xylanase [Chitinispirillaceae bacterium]|nr:endo-1,4-beta-xylanase [Chitinispirillaceae bacterium]
MTGENEHKWSSVEGTRDRMSWTGGDRVADYAKQNNISWKFHTLVWGAQYPGWITGLSTAEQTQEITEWFDETKSHYPEIPMIDVVNEGYMSDPNNWNAGKHAPIPFREAFGGTGSTGFEWIVTSPVAREDGERSGYAHLAGVLPGSCPACCRIVCSCLTLLKGDLLC